MQRPALASLILLSACAVTLGCSADKTEVTGHVVYMPQVDIRVGFVMHVIAEDKPPVGEVPVAASTVSVLSSPSGEAIAETTSEQDGSFRMNIPAKFGTTPFFVRASAPGYRTTTGRIDPTGTQPPIDVKAILAKL